MRRLLSLAAITSLLTIVAPSAGSAQRPHTVRAGQSLSAIARRNRVDVWDLALANDLRPEAMLRPGQVLDVPAAGTTYVRPGQTLSHIAAEHHCSVQDLVRLNRIRERTGLRAGQRLVLPGFAPASEQVAETSTDRGWDRQLEPGIVAVRRHDGVARVRLVDEQNRVTREGLQTLGRLMRRHESDAVELPHPRLVRLIAAISDHFGGREVTLVSGRREAGGYTREASRHVSGQATDIRVAGVSNRALWDYCRSLNSTGCGFYPRSTFVHVDVRERAAQWVDWSTPGGRPRYGNLTRPWPRACRRAPHGRRCTREGRSITRPDEVPQWVELTPAARELMPALPQIAAPLDEPVEEASDDEDELGG